MKRTYYDRFYTALKILCRGEPDKESIRKWIDLESEELQEWAINNSINEEWQGIAVLDACDLLASQPVEGESHIIDYSRPKVKELESENQRLKTKLNILQNLLKGEIN